MIFTNSKLKKILTVFTNVNGLETKLDTLQTFLSNSHSSMDAIAITETSEHKDQSFIANVDLDGYKLFNTPSNSKKGGTALYIKSNYKSFERFDLKIQDNDFESIWTEIRNDKSKNIVCGCIYRHPHEYNMESFFNYMDFVLSKLSNENKEVYICGDFNINLLNINTDDAPSNLYNLFNSKVFYHSFYTHPEL